MVAISRSQREYEKFVQSVSGGTAVKIKESEPSEFLKPVSLQSRVVPRLLLTSTPLSANATFVSDYVFVMEYEKINVRCYQAGGTATIYIEESEDGSTNWLVIKSATINDGQVWDSGLLYPTGNYIRVRVVNDATDETALRVRMSLIP